MAPTLSTIPSAALQMKERWCNLDFLAWFVHFLPLFVAAVREKRKLPLRLQTQKGSSIGNGLPTPAIMPYFAICFCFSTGPIFSWNQLEVRQTCVSANEFSDGSKNSARRLQLHKSISTICGFIVLSTFAALLFSLMYPKIVGEHLVVRDIVALFLVFTACPLFYTYITLNCTFRQIISEMQTTQKFF